jgi:hypothetical protein
MLEPVMPLIELNVPHGQTVDEARRRLETAVHQISTQFHAMVHRVEWAEDRSRVKLDGPGAWVEIWIDAREVHARGDIAVVGALLAAPMASGLRRILQDTFQKALS